LVSVIGPGFRLVISGAWPMSDTKITQFAVRNHHLDQTGEDFPSALTISQWTVIAI
jgi:hypothetical protein